MRSRSQLHRSLSGMCMNCKRNRHLCWLLVLVHAKAQYNYALSMKRSGRLLDY